MCFSKKALIQARLTYFRIFKYLIVSIQILNAKQIMETMAKMEISTNVACRVQCDFCPQELHIEQYSNKII